MDTELDRKMTTGFESHLQNVVKRLNERLKFMKEPAQRHTEILLAKHGLYDLCFQELITYAGNTTAAEFVAKYVMYTRIYLSI